MKIHRSRTRFFALTATCIMVFAGLLVGCSKSKPSEDVVLGAVLPLSGDIAEYGKRCKAGIDMAVAEVNASGGINGRSLKVVFEDSRGLPKDGVTTFRKLIDVHHVQAVIGSVESSSTLAMAPIATQERVVLFSPASSSPKLTGLSPFVFRNWPSDVFEAQTLAGFVHKELGIESAAILYVNNDYGVGLKDEFQKRFVQLGGKVTAAETYEQGANEFRSQLAKLKDTNPQALYLAGYHKEMGMASKQARELGIKCQILGDADYGVQELLTIAGSAAEGVVYATPSYDPQSNDTAIRTFADAFRRANGKEASIFEANGYDAVMILASVMKRGAMTGADIAKAIAAIKDYPGAAGNTTFTSGDVVKPARVMTVRDGKFVEYAKRS